MADEDDDEIAIGPRAQWPAVATIATIDGFDGFGRATNKPHARDDVGPNRTERRGDNGRSANRAGRQGLIDRIATSIDDSLARAGNRQRRCREVAVCPRLPAGRHGRQ